MLTDQQFRQLLGEHVTDDRAERALREEREAWMAKAELERLKVDERVWALEDRLMEMEVNNVNAS